MRNQTMNAPRLHACIGLPLVVALGACGGGVASPPPSVMPESASYQAGSLEPMVVDWQPEQRNDLEASMHDGIVVVEHGRRGLRLLRECRVDGSYGFVGTTRRERVVRLRSKDEVAANLPLGGLGLAARIGGEFEKGATLDIAMVMVGRARSSRAQVTKGDLRGDCAGATHTVRGATLGAFAVDRGEASRARSAAEIFGVGAAAGTQSASSVRVVDGQLASCEAATPESAKPPSQCGAVIRVDLLPIEEPGQVASAGSKEHDVERERCVAPLVSVNGVCVAASRGDVAECKYGDAPACEAACSKGEVASCWKLARMSYRGDGGLPIAPDRAAPLARRACEGNEPRGCVLLGIMHYEGKGVPKDQVRAAQLHRAACQAGDADGCSNLGQMALDGEGGPRDLRLAEVALTRGCNAGRASACDNLGYMALGMYGLKADHARAAVLFKRACDGDHGAGCGNLGILQELGLGTAKNVDGALAAYQKACKLDASTCVFLGAMIQQGRGRTAGGPEPEPLFRRACGGGATSACGILRMFFDPSQPLDPAHAAEFVTHALEFCDGGLARSCAAAGIVASARGDTSRGAPLVARACSMGDDWACLVSRSRKAGP